MDCIQQYQDGKITKTELFLQLALAALQTPPAQLVESIPRRIVIQLRNDENACAVGWGGPKQRFSKDRYKGLMEWYKYFDGDPLCEKCGHEMYRHTISCGCGALDGQIFCSCNDRLCPCGGLLRQFVEDDKCLGQCVSCSKLYILTDWKARQGVK